MSGSTSRETPECDYTPDELTSWVSRDGRTYSLTSGREISEPLRLSEQNGTTLRHALAGHGLPVSGTKRQQAARLANAGVSAAHVEAWHTWRGRDSGPCSQVSTSPAATCPSGCGRNEPCPDPWHDRRVVTPPAQPQDES